LTIVLPEWIAEQEARWQGGDEAARMAFVIDAARRNVETRSGGPFAAAVFEQDSGRLVALGVNRVVAEQLSMLHAEMIALALAQRALGRADLGAAGQPALELVTSVEPCAMCLGALLWSGVGSVIAGASDADARAIGFDEGPKPADWTAPLRARGVTVRAGLLQSEARAVLEAYAHSGGPIYNPG
ncbi:MAG: nucleoside deaminase, partial [Rhodocyclaceae bacterium]|nr:nucleoside deaminase [Rhodocyclaceae bacterium]